MMNKTDSVMLIKFCNINKSILCVCVCVCVCVEGGVNNK